MLVTSSPVSLKMLHSHKKDKSKQWRHVNSSFLDSISYHGNHKTNNFINSSALDVRMSVHTREIMDLHRKCWICQQGYHNQSFVRISVSIIIISVIFDTHIHIIKHVLQTGYKTMSLMIIFVPKVILLYLLSIQWLR